MKLEVERLRSEIDELRSTEYALRPQVAADEIERLREAIKVVVETFEQDEAQGYRSRDRRFAIDILRKALDREAFFAHAKKRPSNKPEDLKPRTDLQKRMQSGSF